MTELEKPNLRSEVYQLENKEQTVATAKSQFSDEYDVPYSNLKGTIFHREGYRRSYPAYCVVIEKDE